MDKIWQTISGLVFAAVMSVTLANKTYAENDETILPETPPAAIAEETQVPVQDEVSGGEVSEEESVSAEEEAVPEEECAPDEEEVPSEDESAAAEEEEAVLSEEAFALTGEGTVPADEGSVIPEEETAEEETDSEEEEDVSIEEETVSLEEEKEETAEEETDSEEEEDVSIEEETVSSEEEEEETSEEEEADPEEEENVSTEEGETAGEEENAPEEEVPLEEEAGVAEEEIIPAQGETVFMLRSALPVNTVEAVQTSGILAAEEESEEIMPAAEETEEETTGPEEDPAESAPNELVLVGDSGTQEVVSEKDIIIKTAGFQHISTLTCDGDVFVIGTGILLVDNVDLLEGRGIYLQSFEEIYGEDGGTAALFVLTGEQDGIKTYTLFNGTGSDGTSLVSAVLDEEYEIPAGISLVVPDGGSLIMQGLLMLVETKGDETAVSYSMDGYPDRTLSGDDVSVQEISTAPTLTISQGASLVIERGAAFQLISARGVPMLDANRPELNIRGSLILNDDAVGGIVVIGNTGNVEGSGFFVNSNSVTVEEGGTEAITDLNIEQVELFVDGTGRDIDSLKTRKRANLFYEAPITIGSVSIEGGTLTIENRYLPKHDTLTVSGTISGTDGGALRIQSGTVLLSDAGACTVPIIEDTTGMVKHGTIWATLPPEKERSAILTAR